MSGVSLKRTAVRCQKTEERRQKTGKVEEQKVRGQKVGKIVGLRKKSS